MKNGYAYRLGRFLAPRGYDLENISAPGNTTADVLARMDKDLAPLDADFVIIGLSMANEGLETGDPAEVSRQYAEGLKKIIARCREFGIVPILGACYSYSEYNALHYEAIRKMNLLTNSWDLPNINFLGAVDNGRGRFPEGCTYDPGHPDNRGHEEMFYTIVPSLFDALAAGKESPSRPEKAVSVTFESPDHPAPLSFIPRDVIHSHAVAFEFRCASAGVLAAVDAGGAHAFITVDGKGGLAYLAASSGTIAAEARVTDNEWHHVALSHRYLQGETLLFLDGKLAGRIGERIVPRRFVLGGPGIDSDLKAPARAGYREWMIFRSSLNADEVRALQSGTMLQASLEIYSLLDPMSLAEDRPVANRAQSLSEAVAFPADVDEDLARIEEQIATAASAREKELVVAEKEPIEVDPAVYADYVGKYRISSDFVFSVSTRDGRIFVNPNGLGFKEIYPEAADKFFVKHPHDELTITFKRDAGGTVTGLVFRAGGRDNHAKRDS
jgi:hypothetical protein